MTDYDDDLPYDGDLNDPRQRCEHGTFIGSWWGPDYLCGWCEEGISVVEMRRIEVARERDRAVALLDRLERLCNAVEQSMANVPYSATLATAVTVYVTSESEGLEP